jgi:PAP2 superfamily C-terminal
LVVFLTQIPDPRKNCSVPSSIFEIRVHRCGGKKLTKIDCIFSGHALIIFVLTKSIAEHKFKSVFHRSISVGLPLIMSIMALIALISSRAHYSVDIFLSLLIAHSNWEKYNATARLNNILSKQG